MKDVCVGCSFVLSVALRIVVMCVLAFIVFVCVISKECACVCACIYML